MLKKVFLSAVFLLTGALALTSASSAHVQSISTDVFTFFLPNGELDDGRIVGKAQLSRSRDGVKLSVQTNELESRAAYSVWWVIFNNPQFCAAGAGACSDSDFANPAVKASVLNATGNEATPDGRGFFNAFLPVGMILTEPASGNVRHAFGPGLQNWAGAEIHIVLRSHGPSTGSPEQISTLFADCLADDGSGGMVCYDAQAAVFPLP